MSDESERPVLDPATLRVGAPLPLVLYSLDLAALLGVSAKTMWRLERTTKFEGLELLPRIGKRRRYSGVRVQQWLDEGLSDWAFAGTRRRAFR